MRRLILLLFFIASAARADQNPLLARWVEAAGGAERLARIEAVHRVEDIDEDGMPGRREIWATSLLQRREVVDHTRDQTLIVDDGSAGWRRDWNGFVEKLAGNDLTRQGNLALVESFAAPAGKAGSPAEIATNTLEFLAKNGSDVRFVLDPSTGLPLRAEMPSFDGTLTVAFSDWRPVDGVRVPFEEVWTTGPNKTTVRLRSIEFVPRERADLKPPKPGPTDLFFPAQVRSVTLPFNFDNNHIMLPTVVNGAGPIWFLLDTGAEFTVINQSHVDEFHMRPYGGLTTIGGGSASTSGAYVEHVTYGFGKAELRDQHAAVLELRGLEEVYGMRVGGILGFDFLSRFIVDVDYTAKTVTLHPRTWDSSRLRGTTVPLVLQAEQPYFAGTIDVRGETIPAWFILDLGAADTITFTTPYVAAHHLIERAGDPRRNVLKVTAPDIAAFNPTNVRGLIDSVTIGDVTLPHVLVNFSAATTGAYTSPAFSGNLCETILSRFGHVILDYGRSVMILQSVPSTVRPFEERKSFGLTIVTGSPDLHRFTVTAVANDSAAAAAGFQKGDVITSVDGTSASRINLAELKRVLAEDKTQHRIVVGRNGRDETLPVHVDLQPISALQ